MKNSDTSLNKKTASSFFAKPSSNINVKSTDINVLLNRVKNNQRLESQKKIYFSAAASVALVLFGLVIFN